LLVEELGHAQFLPKNADRHGGKNASVNNRLFTKE
jgi:hypothetical protein